MCHHPVTQEYSLINMRKSLDPTLNVVKRQGSMFWFFSRHTFICAMAFTSSIVSKSLRKVMIPRENEKKINRGGKKHVNIRVGISYHYSTPCFFMLKGCIQEISAEKLYRWVKNMTRWTVKAFQMHTVLRL